MEMRRLVVAVAQVECEYCGCKRLYYYCYYYWYTSAPNAPALMAVMVVAVSVATAVTINEIGKNDTSSQHFIHIFFRSSVLMLTIYHFSITLRIPCIIGVQRARESTQCVHWNVFSMRSFFPSFSCPSTLSNIIYLLLLCHLLALLTLHAQVICIVMRSHSVRAQRPSSHSQPSSLWIK